MARFLSLLFCLLAALQTLAAPLSKSSYRIAWKQNRDTITLRLEDIDHTEISIDVPVRIVVKSTPGKDILDKEAWKDRVEIQPDETGLIPPLVIRTIPLWPHEVTLSATVIPQTGEKVSNQTNFTIQPPAWSAIVAAIIGGLTWGVISLVTKSGRKAAHVAGEFLLSGLAGCVAWAAANIEAVWKLIGINPESFQLQTYFLLGLCVAYLGVPHVLNLVTRRTGADAGEEQQREPPLTAGELEQHVIGVLNGDAVRKPLREELQEILFDSAYLVRNPELLPQVEKQVLTARYGGVSKDLEDFLSPRTHELYTASHRENARTDLKFTRIGDAFLREETTEYTFVTNERDTREKLIRYAHELDIPLSDRGRDTADIVRIGPLVEGFQLQLIHQDLDDITYVLEDGKPGELVLRCKGGTAHPTVPAEVAVLCQHDKTDHTLSFKFSFPVPKLFVERGRVAVFARLKSRISANDGVYFSQLSALTQTYSLTYAFSPAHRVEVVKYRWIRQNEDRDPEDPPGIARMSGWLVPGNGICLAWYGRDGEGDQS